MTATLLLPDLPLVLTRGLADAAIAASGEASADFSIAAPGVTLAEGDGEGDGDTLGDGFADSLGEGEAATGGGDGAESLAAIVTVMGDWKEYVVFAGHPPGSLNRTVKVSAPSVVESLVVGMVKVFDVSVVKSTLVFGIPV